MQQQNIDIDGKCWSKAFIKFYNIILDSNFYFIIDEDETYNNPNLHSEEQDELEISDGKYFSKSYEYCFKPSYLLYHYYCF